MSIFNKSFLWGIGAGVLLVSCILMGGLSLLFYSLWSYEIDEGAAQARLETPPLPVPSKELADYNWSVTSLDGQELKLADLKGKVIFINFWATWCSPCRVEMPSIQRLYEQTKSQDIVLLCISQENSAEIKAFVEEKGYTLPVYTIAGDPPSAFSFRGIPTTFIISADGKVAFRHIGEAKWDDQRVIDFITGLK